jgi:anthranilate synthase/aminodeoxychorismate synthase-like glutamine amidotransferase
VTLAGAGHSARRRASSTPSTNILLIDNGDSFTASLAQAFRAAGATVEIVSNTIPADGALAYALRHQAIIMLSPGQGGPRDAGCCMELIALAAGGVPLIGICLGHQAIVEHHGGRVVRSHEPSHGKSSAVDHDGSGPFTGLPSPMRVGRYHALCTPLNDVPDRLRVHAVLDGMAMAVSNAEEGQIGLQFHPESVLTPLGPRLVDGLLAWAAERRVALGGLTGIDPAGKVAA